MRRFEGKAALVTGAASGIGKATAERLASEGASVVLADINEQGAREAAASIRERLQVAAHALKFDAASAADCAEIVRASVEKLGRLDIVVNNAGIMQWGQIEAYPDEQWDRVIAINLSAVFRVSKHALPHLFASNGCIINMSSAAGLVGTPYAAAYSTAKAGVAGLTRTMAVELADRGVRVNAICPGGVDTPLNLSAPIPAFADMNKVARLSPKTGKMSRPEEIAAGVAYLASEDACNITGITLSIDGGQVAG